MISSRVLDVRVSLEAQNSHRKLQTIDKNYNYLYFKSKFWFIVFESIYNLFISLSLIVIC